MGSKLCQFGRYTEALSCRTPAVYLPVSNRWEVFSLNSLNMFVHMHFCTGTFSKEPMSLVELRVWLHTKQATFLNDGDKRTEEKHVRTLLSGETNCALLWLQTDEFCLFFNINLT